MTTMQLDLFTHTLTVSTQLPGWGRVITSPNDCWRARWTGPRFGWVFYRVTAGAVWESWEPDLPYGVAHVLARGDAEQMIASMLTRYGDDPVRV